MEQLDAGADCPATTFSGGEIELLSNILEEVITSVQYTMTRLKLGINYFICICLISIFRAKMSYVASR